MYPYEFKKETGKAAEAGKQAAGLQGAFCRKVHTIMCDMCCDMYTACNYPAQRDGHDIYGEPEYSL